VVYLGVWPLPNLIGADEALAGGLRTVHVVLNGTLLVAFSAHVGAALKHYFVDRDAVLARMLPGIGRRES
jgi:cytochrome b561